MKKFVAAVLAAITCCMVALFAACTTEGDKKPEKLKDGIALTITEGESKTIDLSEYISIEGTEFAYTATSSAPSIATVSVDGNTATVVAVAKGSATVTASADEVSVSFAVTVTEKQQVTPEPEEVDKTALAAELALEVTAQGDYTAESYAVYTQKLQTAKAVNAKTDAMQTEVDTACNELKTAREGLTLRVPEEVEGAEKTLAVVSGLSKEIDISDYIDAKNLSSVTYEASSANTLVTVGEIEDGKFAVTAGATEDDVDVALTICAKYKGESKLSVTLTLQVKSEVQPTVNKAQVTQSVDIYSLENKTALTIDFTQNVESNGVENLVYSVTSGVNPVTLDSNNCLTYNLDGTYSETATDVVFNVSVAYGEGKSVSYVYTLKITDTTAYRIANGGFDNGLVGWTLNNNKLGGVNSDETYWVQNVPFNNDGKFFNAYFEGCREEAIGTLTSSPFIIGGSGWITYKLGGARHADKVFLDIVEKDTGNILARYYNNAFFDNPKYDDDTDNFERRGCTLVPYKADLREYIGTTVYIRISDNGINDYGLFFVDSFVTYNTAEPAAYNEETKLGFKVAVPVGHPETIYDIYNGSFEDEENHFNGWTMAGDIGAVTNTEKADWWYQTNEGTKDGDYLFTFYYEKDVEENGETVKKYVNVESNIGTLTSSMFVLKAGKYVSFKFGGGGNRNVFIELVNADSGSIIAVFHNKDNIDGTKLISYSYNAGLTEDTLCYFRIVDNATGENYACFVIDDVRVNLDSAPQGSVPAQDYKGEYGSMVNGSFENGENGLDGWTVTGDIGVVTSDKGHWNDGNPDDTAHEYGKEGNKVFSWWTWEGNPKSDTENPGHENNRETNTGIARSSAFILQKNGIISFRFGSAHNKDVYINVYTTGGRLLATFRNNAYTNDTYMVQYYYQFDNTEEISCYFEAVDNATGNYGCIVMDDFRVNLDAVPEGAVLGSAQTKEERFPANQD